MGLLDKGWTLQSIDEMDINWFWQLAQYKKKPKSDMVPIDNLPI